MNKIGKIGSYLHRAALAYLAAFTIPAQIAFFSLDVTGGTRLMENLAPVWTWLMGAWFLSAAYFCGCLVLSGRFREALLTRISGFKERDEREEIVTAKAARSVFLVTLGCFIAAGLFGMIRVNAFSYTRWQGDRVPPLIKIGEGRRRWDIRKGEIIKRGFVFWPSVGISGAKEGSSPTERTITVGGAEYFYAGGCVYGPEVSRTFFALAAIQVLLFHLFARRVRA